VGTWRVIAVFCVATVAAAAAIAWHAGTWVVLLPMLGAVLVLGAAALAVDYFGLLRRRNDWGGSADDRRRASVRVRAHARQFRILKEQGSPRTSRAARALLLSLAECERFGEAEPVVDFLAADAVFTRVGTDPVADAMRAIALAELGRLDDARKLAGKLLASRSGRRHSVVRYAWARVAQLDRRPGGALEQLDNRLIRCAPRGLRRDMCLLRARALVKLGRAEQASESLRDLCREGRRGDVERLAEYSRERGEAALAVAATHALSLASPYR
jgi:hypothetical protein